MLQLVVISASPSAPLGAIRLATVIKGARTVLSLDGIVYFSSPRMPVKSRWDAKSPERNVDERLKLIFVSRFTCHPEGKIFRNSRREVAASAIARLQQRTAEEPMFISGPMYIALIRWEPFSDTSSEDR